MNKGVKSRVGPSVEMAKGKKSKAAGASLLQPLEGLEAEDATAALAGSGEPEPSPSGAEQTPDVVDQMPGASPSPAKIKKAKSKKGKSAAELDIAESSAALKSAHSALRPAQSHQVMELRQLSGRGVGGAALERGVSEGVGKGKKKKKKSPWRPLYVPSWVMKKAKRKKTAGDVMMVDRMKEEEELASMHSAFSVGETTKQRRLTNQDQLLYELNRLYTVPEDIDVETGRRKSYAGEARDFVPSLTGELVVEIPIKDAEHTMDNITIQAGFAADLEDRLWQAGFIVDRQLSQRKDAYLLGLTANNRWLERMAEVARLSKKMKDEFGGGYTEFQRERRHMFEAKGELGCLFNNKERTQILMHGVFERYQKGGAQIPVAEYKNAGLLRDVFPLHKEPDRRELWLHWVGWWNWGQRENLDRIRDYFGEQIGIYFGWLGFYTMALFPMVILGTVLFIKQINDRNFDNNYVPWYCLITAAWATLFMKFWTRKQSELAFYWGTTDYEVVERPRLQFKGKLVQRSDGSEYMEFPMCSRIVRTTVSFSVMFLTGVLIMVASLAIMYLKYVLTYTVKMGTYGKSIAGILNGLFISITNVIYKKVAYKLTTWENCRTDSQFEDRLVIKTFLLQFFNSYASLFYIAFFKNVFHDYCHPSCMSELSVQLGSILVTRMTVGNVVEVFMPYLVRQIRIRMRDSSRAKVLGITVQDLRESIADEEVHPYEHEAHLGMYQTTFDDYNEVVLQFGFVFLFFPAAPVGAALAFFSNLIELRTDLYKLMYEVKRPLAKGASNIGTWYSILETMSILAVMTNCAILGITSSQVRAFEDVTTRVLFVVIIEHAILAAKFYLSRLIDDTPEWVKVMADQQKFTKSVAFDKLDIALGKYDESSDEERARDRMAE